MNFTRLRLNGFKSFVDPTDVQILPGLTGIVGPNGCGKSNLLDALKWVMGENRPTSMRGEGMDDVIFGGSDLRSARAFAEVVLELEDFDTASLSLNPSSNSIEIVRRINLESGSTYRIEGKEVLAREIRMLFADSSTGSNSPSLVRQGQIANLINENPKSRRKILEEAAGIAGIYHRRHESELKLNASENNLARVDDILSKLQDQLKVLAKQASQAGEYRSLGVSIRHEEALLLYAQWKDKKFEVEKAKQVLGEIVKTQSTEQRIHLDLCMEREKREESLPSTREKQAADQIVFRQLQSMKDSLNEKHKLAVLRIDELKKRTSDLDSDFRRETEMGRDAEGVLQKLSLERKELEVEQLTLEKRFAKATHESEVSEIEFKQQELDYDRQASDYAKILAEKETAEKNHVKYKKNLELIEEKLAQVKADKISVATRRVEIERNKKQVAVSLDETERSLSAESELLVKLERDCHETRNVESELKEKLSESKSRLAATISEVEALEELSQDKALSSNAILHKVSVASGYELALGAVLSDELNFSEKSTGSESGWLHFKNEYQGKDLPEGAKVLADFVKYPQRLSRRLKNIGVVNLKDGPKLQSKLLDGQALVSKEGDLWRWDGFVRRSSDISSETVLKLKNANRLKRLQLSQDEIEKSMLEDEERYQSVHRKLTKLIETRDIKKREHTDLEKELMSLKLNLSKLEAEFEINQAQMVGFNDKDEQLRRDFKEFSNLMDKYEINEDPDQDLIKKEKTLNDKKDKLESFRSKDIESRLKLEEIFSKDKHGKARLRQISDDMIEWESRQKRSLNHQTSILGRKDEFDTLLEAAITQPAKIEKEIETLDEKILEAEKECTCSTDALVEAEKSLREAFLRERDSQKLTEELKEKYVRAEVSLETMKNNMGEMAVSLEGNTGMMPNDFESKFQKEEDEILSISAIHQKLEKLKRRREMIGPVNLRAEEDEKEIAQEFDTLNAQKKDLEGAVKKLRKAIADLNKEGRGKLLSAFEQVNENFQKLFKTLFGGGSSNLMFIESEDPLEAGLEIMCQPPGKKLSSLSLLSGGEQTLAAIALIFAVFLARPSPICVLDEVDAPLDDANVVRFCKLLDEMNSKTETRFLIITHNPITMAKMNRLYGVTMGEKGVSQLVSVDLDKAEELVEA